MTSEKRLREIARNDIEEHRCFIAEGLNQVHPDLTEEECDRLYTLIRSWPILDLPVPDRNGCFWPLRGRNYGHIRRTMIQPHVGDPFPGVVIARGGPGEVSHHTSMTLTRAEALELAGILTAAAMEEE